MSAELSAAEGAILKGADTVSNTRADLKQRLTALRADVDAVGSSWTGLGAVAFSGLMVAWDAEANQVTDALENLESALRGTQTAFDQAEQVVETGLNKLIGMLGGVGN
nr:WXG100 family type VII secretion target [Propionicimonas sp.]